MRSELSRLKRFWKSAAITPLDDGWGVSLDARPLRTPAKALFIAPTQAAAKAVAEEWNAQEGEVDPAAMAVTRYINSAIDRVAGAKDQVAAQIAEYGASDLLCYRAPHPQALAERQAAAWDPILAWLRERFDAPLTATSGISHVAQPRESLARLRAAVAAQDPFVLAALWDLVGITGSLGLGLAIRHGRLTAEAGWAASRIDEDWQIAHWGEDAEAAAAAARKHQDLMQAAAFLSLLNITPPD